MVAYSYSLEKSHVCLETNLHIILIIGLRRMFSHIRSLNQALNQYSRQSIAISYVLVFRGSKSTNIHVCKKRTFIIVWTYIFNWVRNSSKNLIFLHSSRKSFWFSYKCGYDVLSPRLQILDTVFLLMRSRKDNVGMMREPLRWTRCPTRCFLASFCPRWLMRKRDVSSCYFWRESRRSRTSSSPSTSLRSQQANNLSSIY